MGRRGWIVAAAIAAGCGPRTDEPEVALRTCGQDGPARLLEVDGMIPVHVERFATHDDGHALWRTATR